MKVLKLLLASTFVLCGTQAFADSTTTTTIEQSAPAVVHETEHVKEVEQVPVPVPVEVPAPENHSSYSSSSSSEKIIKKSEAPETKTTTVKRRVAYRAPQRRSCAKSVSTSCNKSSCAKPATEVIEKHESHTESNSSDNQ